MGEGKYKAKPKCFRGEPDPRWRFVYFVAIDKVDRPAGRNNPKRRRLHVSEKQVRIKKPSDFHTKVAGFYVWVELHDHASPVRDAPLFTTPPKILLASPAYFLVCVVHCVAAHDGSGASCLTA